MSYIYLNYIAINKSINPDIDNITITNFENLHSLSNPNSNAYENEDDYFQKGNMSKNCKLRIYSNLIWTKLTKLKPKND